MGQAKRTIFQNLQAVWETNPLIFQPDTQISVALSKIYPSATSSLPERFSYAVAIEDNSVVGTIEDKDFLQLTLDRVNWQNMTIRDIMSPPEILRSSQEAQDFWQVLARFERTSRSHLVIVDETNKLQGTIDLELLVKALPSLNMLKSRWVDEIMEVNFIQAAAETSALALGELMRQKSKNCVVITENRDGKISLALGLILASDILHLQLLGIDLKQVTARSILQRELSKVSEKTALSSVLEILQQQPNGSIVTGKTGELQGIILPRQMLRVFQPHAILAEIEALHQELDKSNSQINSSESLLIDNDKQLQAIFQRASDAIVILDDLGRFIDINPSASRFFGLSPTNLIGCSIEDFLTADTDNQLKEQNFLQNPATTGETSFCLTDGSVKQVEYSTISHYIPHRHLIILRDITQRYQVQIQLQQQYRQTQLLAEMTRKIRGSLELEDIIKTTVREVRELLKSDRVTIVKLQANGTVVSIGESVVGDFPQIVGYEIADPLLMDLEGYSQGKILAITDINKAEISPNTKDLLKQFAIRAKLVVPILSPQLINRHRESFDRFSMSENRLQGLLIAHQCSHPREWQDSEIELLQQLADRLGLAIAQAQLLDNLEGRVKERTRELTIANIQLQQEIEEHQQTEVALRENQQKLAGILDCADEAIISIDERSIVQLFNQSAEKMFGYSADRVLGKPLDILLPSVFVEIHRQHVTDFGNTPHQARSMAERSNRVFGRRRDGSQFPAEASISKMRSREGLIFTVMLKDITERQQAEAALRRSEEQLRSIANALPILIAYIDNRRRYRFNNRAHEIWFGKASAEIDNCHLKDIVGIPAYRQIAPYVRNVLSGKTVTFELELINHDGNLRWVSACYIPDFDERDRVKGFFATFDDISKRKALEQMQSEFVSIASHEMRTPLTSIHGVLKLLAANRLGELTPKGIEMTQIALRNTDRSIRLINDVLDLERMESGRETIIKQVCHSDELIRQAADTIQEMARSEEITLEIDAVKSEFWADADLILQTLTNLLSNGIKFSPPNSIVTIKCRECGDCILFSVIDRGRGIPADKLEIIFERFQQVDASDSRKKGGTGLGLSICRHIVNKHEGKIWVESVVGEGSTFYFTLPKNNLTSDR
jgi:PAS domain S-box-containing protein